MFEKYLTKTGRLSKKQPQEIKNWWYIQKFQEVHGDTYDYSNVVYDNQLRKVEIICVKHGSFHQTPDSHLRGRGCPFCAGKIKKTTEQCVKDFVSVHGNTYDYSKVVYKDNQSKVLIFCKNHGCFSQRPYDHLQGHGCPKCQNHNQDTLYVLRCINTGLTKIGITGNLGLRLTSIGGQVRLLHHIAVENPRELEKQLHDLYKQHRIFNPTVKNGGTEFFDLSDQQVQEIMEILDNVGTTTS